MDPEDTGGETAVEGTDVQPDIQPDPTPHAPVTTDGQTWAGPSQDEWAATLGAVQQLVQYAPILGQLGQYMNAPQAEEIEIPEINDWDPESIQAHVDARIARERAALMAEIGPLRETHQQMQARQAYEQARGYLDQVASRDGDFDRDGAERFAAQYLNAGWDPRAALEAAAKQQREYETGLKAKAVEEYKATMGSIAEAAQEGAGGAGAATEITPNPVGKGWGVQFATGRAA